MTSEWYCQIGDRIDGSFTVAELLRLAADGKLGPRDKVRRGKGGAWIEARQLPGLTFPDDLEKRSEAVSTARPEPVVRERRKLASEERDDESILDILSRPFDSPQVRAERLLALTGGEKPVELFRTCKVTWQKKAAQWYVNADPHEFYADLVFTDCGLLVVKHAQLPKRGESGNSAWIHFGLIGLIAYSIAESSRMSRDKNKAEEVYFREAEDWDGAKPAVLFRRIPQAEFLPADEISEVQFRKRGILKFRFRGHWCWATPDANERHEEFRLPALEEIERWLDEAAGARTARTEGPPEPGPGALVEWAKRPVAEPPQWVVTALQRMEAHHGEEPNELLQWIPKQHRAELFHRLADVDAPEAQNWRERLARRLRVRGFILLSVGLLIVLAGAGLGVVVANDNPGRNNDNVVTGAVVGGCIALIGVLCSIWGLSVLNRFRVRSEK